MLGGLILSNVNRFPPSLDHPENRLNVRNRGSADWPVKTGIGEDTRCPEYAKLSLTKLAYRLRMSAKLLRTALTQRLLWIFGENTSRTVSPAFSQNRVILTPKPTCTSAVRDATKPSAPPSLPHLNP